MRERAPARFDEAVADDHDEDDRARIFGADRFEEAVSVTQHIWPVALAENAPGENDNDPLTATPIIHFTDDAPVL
jgi:hypothetical protein